MKKPSRFLKEKNFHTHTPESNAEKFQKSPQFIILWFFMTDLQMPRLLNDSVHKKMRKRA